MPCPVRRTPNPSSGHAATAITKPAARIALAKARWQPVFEWLGCVKISETRSRGPFGVRMTVNALTGIVPVVGFAGVAQDGGVWASRD
jgi:hypothetical protein